MKIRVTDRGIIEESSGNGVEFETTPQFSAGQQSVQTLLTVSQSIKRGGFYNLSSSGGCAHLTIGLPAPGTVPGQTFSFRALSTGSHIISASGGGGEFASRIVMQYSGNQGATSMPIGTKFRFPVMSQGITGSSVTMLCDGQNFLVLAVSGAGYICTNAALANE